jgi:hypothetical protein
MDDVPGAVLGMSIDLDHLGTRPKVMMRDGRFES